MIVDDRNNAAFLRSYLTPEFKAAIDSLADNSAVIFRDFGTHLLTGITVGARMDYSYSARNNRNSGSEDIAVYANASYKSVFKSASIESNTASHSNWKNWYSDVDTKTTVNWR